MIDFEVLCPRGGPSRGRIDFGIDHLSALAEVTKPEPTTTSPS
jgi:hypothetical protein